MADDTMALLFARMSMEPDVYPEPAQTAAVDEFQGMIPDQLADYWLRGKGAARVRWCTRGAFRRARRLLRGKVPAEMLDGTVANLYHRACGRWPGRRGNEAAFAEEKAVLPTEDAPNLEVVGEDATGVGYKRVDWDGPLAPIDIATGDRRRFAPGALSTRQLPLPFRWQEKAAQGHDGSVVVGALTGYDIADDGTIMGRGYFLDPDVIPDVRKAMHLVEHGVVGPSVDLEPDMDVVAADEAGEEFDPDACAEDGTCPDKPQALITRATIAGATLVPITAFAEARAPQLTPHGEFCLNPLHPGPCASGGSSGGGGGKGKKPAAKTDAAKPKAEAKPEQTPAQAPGRGVLDALVREKFLDAPQTPNDDRTPEERQADDERAAERAKVENRRARRAEVRAKAAAARERYGPRSKWPKRVRANVEREEERVSQLAAVDEHADCRPHEFCRSPLHPGPCKGWKNKGRSSSSSSGGTRRKTPAKDSGKSEEPPPPDPDGPPILSDGSRAVEGKDAYRAAATTDTAGEWMDDQRLARKLDDAAVYYTGDGYRHMNGRLRSGRPLGRGEAEYVRALDAGTAELPLRQDVALWRGIASGQNLFGREAFDGSLVGAEWTEPAFVSTSARKEMIDSFARPAWPDSVRMRVLAPAGTGALRVGEWGQEAEVLLGRENGFRVVADHGKVDGVRRLDVEVIPGTPKPYVGEDDD